MGKKHTTKNYDYFALSLKPSTDFNGTQIYHWLLFRCSANAVVTPWNNDCARACIHAWTPADQKSARDKVQSTTICTAALHTHMHTQTHSHAQHSGVL